MNQDLKNLKAHWKRFCLHVHTSPKSSDATLSPDRAVRLAEQAGFAGLVFTEHDVAWTQIELDELRTRTGTSLTLLAGLELNLPEAHLLVFGVDHPVQSNSPRAADLVAAVHSAGGVCLVAHPWEVRFQIPAGLAKQWGADGVELFNSNSALPSPADLEACSDAGLAVVAGVDAHHATDSLDRAWTMVPEGMDTTQDFVEAVRSRQTQAWRRDGREESGVA